LSASSALLLGATSIVGYNLARLYPHLVQPVCTARSNYPAAATWPRLRLEDAGEVAGFLQERQPRTILYCDAVCDVEKCEKNPAWAEEINVGNLRRFLSVLDADVRFIYVSTDHVFGGNGTYDEKCAPCPVSFYGRTRVRGEELALAREGTLVIRPGLPIGASIDGRTGHRDWLRYRTREGLPITIVHDEHRSAVAVEAMCDRMIALAESDVTGIRNLAAAPVDRPSLARFLCAEMRIGETFDQRSRFDQRTPHLGHVELATIYNDDLAQRLPSYVAAPQDTLLLDVAT